MESAKSEYRLLSDTIRKLRREYKSAISGECNAEHYLEIYDELCIAENNLEVYIGNITTMPN